MADLVRYYSLKDAIQKQIFANSGKGSSISNAFADRKRLVSAK